MKMFGNKKKRETFNGSIHSGDVEKHKSVSGDEDIHTLIQDDEFGVALSMTRRNGEPSSLMIVFVTNSSVVRLKNTDILPCRPLVIDEKQARALAWGKARMVFTMNEA